MKKSPTVEEIKAVFDYWNKYKGRGKWKSHREITYDIECAIKDTLKHYTVQQICEAINNYALILLGKEYRWSYVWPLALFLTRHRPDDRQILQFTRFLGNGNFIADEYLSAEGLKRKIEKQHWPIIETEDEQVVKWVKQASEETLITRYNAYLRRYKGSITAEQKLIDKYRPEIKDKIKYE